MDRIDIKMVMWKWFTSEILFVFVYTHTHTHMHMHAHTHTHTYTCMYTCKHTLKQKNTLRSCGHVVWMFVKNRSNVGMLC